MGFPLVSCIVPVFNGERYLAETLDNILAQTHSPLEVIVVDDGSTDGTAAILAGYAEKIRYIFQENVGPAAAYNTALAVAQGEFVAFLGADDLWHREKTARQLASFEARPELGYCVTHLENFWIPELKEEAERFRGHRLARPMPGYTSATMEILPDVLMYRRIHHTNRSRRLADNSRKTFLGILKASLDRRRRQGDGQPSDYSFPK